MSNEPRHVFLLRLCQHEHSALDAVLEPLSPTILDETGLAGDWSIKQTLAHISWWERDVVSETMRRQVLDPGLNGQPWDTDRANALVAQARRDDPLADVLAEYRASFGEVVSMLEALPDERLDDETYRFIVNNTAHHYREHRELIEGALTTG